MQIYISRVEEANKEWEATKRLATGGACYHLGLRGQGKGVDLLSHSIGCGAFIAQGTVAAIDKTSKQERNGQEKP